MSNNQLPIIKEVTSNTEHSTSNIECGTFLYRFLFIFLFIPVNENGDENG